MFRELDVLQEDLTNLVTDPNRKRRRPVPHRQGLQVLNIGTETPIIAVSAGFQAKTFLNRTTGFFGNDSGAAPL